MKIRGVTIDAKQVPLKRPYRIAGRTIATAGMVFVALRDEAGHQGYGAGSPTPDIVGDDLESTRRALEERVRPALAGADATDLDAAVNRVTAAAAGFPAACAAADIALHDLHARRRGVPLVKMLGGARRRLVTSVTIGIEGTEAMVQRARALTRRGFRAIKVKIGEDPEADIARIGAIRAAVGASIRIRVDANEGYAPDHAARVAHACAGLDIELIEQPVSSTDLAGLRLVGSVARCPVVIDEGVRMATDLAPFVMARAARGANIKLMKCGGILEARRIDAALTQAGWSALVGCMDESCVAIAAAAHFAAAAASVSWIDLDGSLDLAADPFTGGFTIRDGEIVLSDAPGLGVHPARRH